MLASYTKSLRAAFVVLSFLALALSTYAQSGGSSTAITGTVLDPSGAAVANATVQIHNPVSGLNRTTLTDNSGTFTIPNVPFNLYHVSVAAEGFNSYARDIDVRSVVPVNLSISLKVKGSAETVIVESEGDLLENHPPSQNALHAALLAELRPDSKRPSQPSL